MRTPDSLSTLGESMVVSANADQAEQLSLSRGVSAVADASADELMSGSLNDDVGMDFAATDRGTESLVGETLAEIERRSQKLGAAYPFHLERGALRYTGTGDGVYEFCLNVSCQDHAEGNASNLEIAFERMAAILVSDFLGGGESFRTGYPSHNLVERPKRLAATARLLNSLSREWAWSPQAPNPEDPDTTEVKDEGVDFVAWKRLDDRIGSLFVAGQCACGLNWRNKLDELRIERIQRWWAQPTRVPLVRAFAIPRAIPGDLVIGEISRQAGLVFDRLRFTHVAARAGRDSVWIKHLIATSQRADASTP